MTNWQPIVDHFLRMSDPEGECNPYCPPGASDEVLAALEAALGVALPIELREFYRHCDGLGLVPRDGGSMPLFVRPTHELSEFIASCRASFSETHPQYSQRFFPCVDWNNGDSSGFMLDLDGRFLDGIYTFSHEGYSFDAAQDVNDFLFEQADNLASLLHPE
jgi:hypothetical protein